MKKIKLMADYQCYPLWVNSSNEVGNIDPDTLPISDFLKKELNDWSEEYDATLDLDDPANSGFKNLEDEVNFKKKGSYLQEELQKELGNDFEITYQS